MSYIVDTLPALPDDMIYDNYILLYYSNINAYSVLNFNYSDTITVNSPVSLNNFVYYHYYISRNTWSLASSSRTDGSCSFRLGNEIISSTVDIYNPDGSIHCSSVSRDYFTSSGTVSIISDTITPSTVLSALNDTKIILPIIVVVLVGMIALRKAWNFLRGCVRGV